MTTNYRGYYLKGVDTAVYEAKRKGYQVDVRVFSYGQHPLSILEIIPKVLAWKPDVIIGPRDSNRYLLLSNKIKRILVISPFATSSGVQGMPNNFFSLTLPVENSANAMINFIKDKYPHHGVYILEQANCKSCSDLSRHFKKSWENRKYGKVVSKPYLPSELSLSFMKKALINYKKSDVILLSGTAHASAILMPMVTQYVKHSVIFVGGDGWGSWKDTEVGKINSNYDYTAFHIVPWSLFGCDQNMIHFKREYLAEHKKSADGMLSFLSYFTVKSFMTAYERYSKNFKGSVRSKLLSSYQLAIRKNLFYFKPKNYFVFQIKHNKNKLIGKVSAIKLGMKLYSEKACV